MENSISIPASSRKERRSKPKKASAAKAVGRFNVPKIFLLLSITIGILLSFSLPLFNESDGQYHFVDATNMVGLTTDITSYGESASNWNGFSSVASAIQDRDYFDRYFVQKVHSADMSQLPRLNKISPILSFDYLGHLIPAAGVWLGYHIYPSMGIMIIVARLLQTFISSFVLYFIIKRLKGGQLLFAAVALSPTIMNQMASLSYDMTSYLFAAGIVAFAINACFREKLSFRLIAEMLVISLLSFFFLKTNLILFLVLFPILIIGLWLANRKPKDDLLKHEGVKQKFNRTRVLIAGLVAIVIILLIGQIITAKYGGIFSTLGRLLVNFTYFWGDGRLLSRNIMQVFASPLGLANHVPLYATALWFILIALIAFSEEKFIKSKWIAYSSLVLFLGGIAAVYYGYFAANYDSTPRGMILGQIAEIQGRYFTPSALLLPLIVGYKGFKLKVTSKASLVTMMIIVVILTNGLLVFGTWFSLINT
ncbi:DUF2142 domain-containing protein [Lactococcus termiticola]|uniref:Membrane protein n=1 Tax=Lactococcus termiticola TaxID=2169526 RepID=A0A2R5HEQ9_9LACT|nr:DUF2142 domain-containing protein [Lactococcus termiticola]GBG96539.1 membrane protein [Lactococcus termiticola]